MAQYQLTRLPDRFRPFTAAVAASSALLAIGTAGVTIVREGFSALPALLLGIGCFALALAVQLARGRSLLTDEAAERSEAAVNRISRALDAVGLAATLPAVAMWADYLRHGASPLAHRVTGFALWLGFFSLRGSAKSTSLAQHILASAQAGGLSGLLLALIEGAPALEATVIGMLIGALGMAALIGLCLLSWRGSMSSQGHR